MLDLGDTERGLIDYLGIGLCTLALATLVSLGLYGLLVSFLQSAAYLKANEWVALGMGVLGAGCGLYLVVELGGRLQGRQIVAICIVAAMFSIFAVTKGVPAALTLSTGHITTVTFTVTGHGSGGKGCSTAVKARHDGYEEFSICETALPHPVTDGDRISITGIASPLGLVRQSIRLS